MAAKKTETFKVRREPKSVLRARYYALVRARAIARYSLSAVETRHLDTIVALLAKAAGIPYE